MIDENEIVNFLFWFQYVEQDQLRNDWFGARVSNRYIAQKFLEWLEKPCN